MLSDYTTAELRLMLIKHDERRVILTQSKIKEIKEEINHRNGDLGQQRCWSRAAQDAAETIGASTSARSLMNRSQEWGLPMFVPLWVLIGVPIAIILVILIAYPILMISKF